MRAAYDPHGAALLECFRGDESATLIVDQDGERDDVPASFWLRDTIDPIEAMGLDLCRGHVLDVGAGAGVHSLELQRRGHEVTAIDIAPACVTIMRERGVRNALVVDMFDVAVGGFDTILCLCNGLDKVGRLADLPRFLDHARALLVPSGQLLADSFDLRVGANEAQLDRITRKQQAGRYFGEIDLCFEYKGQRGRPFSALHVDYETFAGVAEQAGWQCERVHTVGGHYLVRARPTP